MTQTDENPVVGEPIKDFAEAISGRAADGARLHASPENGLSGEEIYRAVLEHAAENIFVVDVETRRVLESNAAFNRSLGYGPQEIRNLTLYDLVAHDREGIDRNVRLVLERGSLDVGGRRYRRADGTLLDVEVKVSVVPRGGGRALCVVAHDVTERNRAEEALRRSEAGLANAQRLTHLGNWEWDFVTGEAYWSDELYRIYGYAPQEFEPRVEGFMGLVHPGDKTRVGQAGREALRGGESYDLEHRILRPDGTERVVHCRSEVFFDGAGRAVRAVGTVQDVTERRRAEEELEMSETRLRMMIEQAPFSVQILALDGTTLRVNRAWERLWGVKLEQIAGYNVLHDAQLEEKGVLPYLRRAFAGEAVEVPPIKYEPAASIPDAGGVSHRWVRAVAYPVQDESGRIREVVLAHEDITERMRAEEELRESHALLKSVIEGTADAIFVKDLEGRYQLANGVTARITVGPGCAAEDLIGRDDTEFFPPEVARKLRELDRIVVETGEVRIDEEIVPLDGADRIMLSTKAPYRDHRGEIVGVIGVATDITERKDAERALFEVREAERTRIARDLHDTVLHHLVGVLQTMQAAQVEDSAPRGDLAWQVEALRGAIKGLRNAIYDLRQERAEPLVRTVEALVELNRHLAPDREFVLTVGDEPSREPPRNAKVDLARIIQEALTNARRHSGAGRIEVRLGAGEDGEFVAEVADDGRGLDPGVDIDGVGLSTMRERALVMGARLVIAGAPGRGTKVRVSVPDRAPARDGSPTGRGRTRSRG